jgi:UMF1 family MFS transporter
LASIGYSGSLVFYNAYLPDITSAENYDSISARGYSFGYIGSVLLLVVSLLLIENFETLGFSSELQAVKLSFLLVGVWWFGFAQVSFYYLPKDQYKVYELTKTISKGYQEIAKVWNQLKELKVMK